MVSRRIALLGPGSIWKNTTFVIVSSIFNIFGRSFVVEPADHRMLQKMLGVVMLK